MQISECNAPVVQNMSRIIKDKGLKKVYVAEKAGYAPQELTDMLNGRKIIKASDVLKLACALGVGAGELFETERGGVRNDAGEACAICGNPHDWYRASGKHEQKAGRLP